MKTNNSKLTSMLHKALKFHQTGKLDDALALYKKVLKEQPENVDTLYLLGALNRQTGNLDEALVLLKKSLVLKPDNAIAHNDLGSALHALGRFSEAIISYKQATILMPLNAELHNNLGAALQELEKFDEAILSCRHAIALDPKLAKAHNNLGIALTKQHKLDDAMKCFNRAIALKTDYAEAYYNLGHTLHKSDRFDEAIEAYKRAISIKPHYAKAYYNLGNSLKVLNRVSEAVTCYKQSIAIKPDYVMAHNNLGTVLQEQGKINEAAECYSRAIGLKPDYAEAHLNKAITSLLNGDLENGWREYEWRLQTTNYTLRKFNRPMWDGGLLNGKTILIHTEQGFGDTVQFIRYLPMLQALGGRVIFECLKSLTSLLKNCAGIDRITEKKSSGKLPDNFDVHAPLLSLPGLIGTTLESIPSDGPYIDAGPDLIDKWRIRLDDDNKYKIGIVWAGNPNHMNDHSRSCPLSHFASLSEISGLSFYSLQKGEASADINNPSNGIEITNIDIDLNDFTDTAAVIANLDLVISVDTVVAHLAGAIGKPVWTLLPFAPDWRWLLNRSDSPWYPSMRLFRQTRPDDWAGVFEQVKEALILNFENPTISLCMIVKDEEENLARCLESTKDIVDEIIIVDTGSTDKTVEIAKSYGAKVFNHPWEGSFSKARNYSLEYATCDWILILDADEELNRKDTYRLRETVKNSDCPVISFIIINKYQDSTQEGHAQMVRLYKNFNGTHYKGIVHNTIQYHGKCLYSSISVIHHGYNLSEEKMQKKFLRTSTLLKKQIESGPHNPVPYMYLGVAYMDRRMYEDAIVNSKKAICLAEESWPNNKDFLVSYYIVSAAYSEMKRFKDSEIYALMSVELDNQFLDGYCLLAFAYYNLKEYDNFMDASENYLTIWSKIANTYSSNTKLPPGPTQKNDELNSKPPSNVIYHTIGHKWKIHLLRGFCYLSSNRNESGNSEIDKAINSSTDLEDCFTLLGNYYIETNCIDKAEDAYRRLLSINEKSINALFNLGHIKFQKSDLNGTLFFWKKAVEIGPTLFDIRLLICKVNVALGNFEDVVVDCDQLLQLMNMSREISIESLSDLGNVFDSISENLKEENEVQSAETAYRICEDLKQIGPIDTSCVSTTK